MGVESGDEEAGPVLSFAHWKVQGELLERRGHGQLGP